MIRSLLMLIVWAALMMSGSSVRAQAQPNLLVLCYHDVVDTLGPKDDVDTVSLESLTKQLEWLKRSGYHFATADEVFAARKGGPALPAKSVLLTFDDGYKSFYTHVYPALRLANVPAVLSVVGSWLQPDARGLVNVDGVETSADRFLSLDELKEISESGTVEIASHTYDLHRALLANALGSRIPAAIARTYDPKSKTNEDETSYEKRLVADLRKNAEFLRGVTGKAPRIVVWPYGRYNGAAVRAATTTGAEVSFTLDELSAERTTSTSTLGRKYIQNNPSLRTFTEYAQRIPSPTGSVRHLAINMESFVASDRSDVPMAEVDAHLSKLLEDVSRSTITTVLVNPFSSSCKAYHPQSQHPIVRDILSRVVWQLRTRARVQVYLDLDVAGCLHAGLARPELLTLLTVSSFDGLVMRTDSQSHDFARELAEVFQEELPNRPVASNVEFANRTTVFQELNACRLPSDENLRKLAQEHTWLELRSEGCDLTDAYTRLRNVNARSWGLYAANFSLSIPRVLQPTAVSQ